MSADPFFERFSAEEIVTEVRRRWQSEKERANRAEAACREVLRIADDWQEYDGREQWIADIRHAAVEGIRE